MNQLENALDGVLVELQQIRHRPIAERGILLDHLFGRPSEGLLHNQRLLRCLVVRGAARVVEFMTHLTDRNGEAILLEPLADRLDCF